MATNIILKFSKLFMLEMTDEDMQHLNCIVTTKNSNFFDVVLACFHAGLVLLTEQCNCNICRSSKHDEEKKDHKKARSGKNSGKN